jgi:hypothetical protein
MARLLVLTFGIVALAALAACNTDQLPPPGQFTAISGQVTDRATQQPIAGAVVTIDTVLTATTDSAGKFTIPKVPAGSVDYSVQANGYAIASSTATAQPGIPFALNVTLIRTANAP